MSKKPLILVLVGAITAFGPTGVAAAQRPAPQPPAAPIAQANADDTRDQLEDLLKQCPPTLPQVLKVEPTLLENAPYLQPYPALAGFLEKHPEIGHNPE